MTVCVYIYSSFIYFLVKLDKHYSKHWKRCIQTYLKTSDLCHIRVKNRIGVSSGCNQNVATVFLSIHGSA